MSKVLWACVVANLVFALSQFTDIVTPAYIIILLLLIILCSGDNIKTVKLLGIVTAVVGIVLSVFGMGNFIIIASGIAIILEVIHEFFVGTNNKKYDKSMGVDGLEEKKEEVIKIAMEFDIDRIRDTFDNYVEEFDKSNHLIDFKYKHTVNVANNAQNIARSIGLDEEGRYLAYTIGILHDIGRFEQIKQFNTLDDTDTVDHANHGCILLEEGLIRQFIHENKYDQIILRAVKNHNKFTIDDNFSDDEKLYCSILRDADKLDILKHLSEGEFEDNVTRDMLISSEITREITQKHSIEFSLVNNNLDLAILRLAMIYDVNYEYTLKTIKKNDYLNKYIVLLDTLDTTKLILRKIVNDIYEDINNKLK
jgi:putative nucleotidyltransferase with HDIG domain